MSERLSGLENKKASGNVQPYSSFVKWVKVILPLMVLGIIGLLIIYPQLSNIETSPLTKEDLTALQKAETENNLLKPVYNTLDSEGQPFSITAEEARQERDNSEKVYLVKPTAEMNAEDNKLYLNAADGEYDQNKKILILKNGVTLKDDQNNVLTTDDLTTSLADNKAESKSPAKLTTDQGVIEGRSVSIDHKNQTTTFQGPAKAVINQ